MGRGNLERGSGHNSNRNNNTFFPFFSFVCAYLHRINVSDDVKLTHALPLSRASRPKKKKKTARLPLTSSAVPRQRINNSHNDKKKKSVMLHMRLSPPFFFVLCVFAC